MTPSKDLKELLKRLGKYDDAMKMLARHGVLRLGQMFETRRQGAIKGRREIVALLRKHTTMSTVEIGTMMGLDPTNVLGRNKKK